MPASSSCWTNVMRHRMSARPATREAALGFAGVGPRRLQTRQGIRLPWVNKPLRSASNPLITSSFLSPTAMSRVTSLRRCLSLRVMARAFDGLAIFLLDPVQHGNVVNVQDVRPSVGHELGVNDGGIRPVALLF